jgi:glycerol kinase
MLLQMQSDQLGVTVQRPIDQETTALGAAYLAGLAEGVWPSWAAINERWEIDATFHPEPDRTFTDLGYDSWLRAVERSRGWVES